MRSSIAQGKQAAAYGEKFFNFKSYYSHLVESVVAQREAHALKFAADCILIKQFK